jgi:putative aldouronate transport system substrate-binding protein
MKTSKKIGAFALSAALVLGLLSGCGSNQTESSQPEQNSASSSVQEETTAVPETKEETSENEAPETEPKESAEASTEEGETSDFELAPDNLSYPLTPEDNQITFYQQLGQGILSVLPSYNDSYIDQTVEDATGIDMQFVEVSDSVINEQYSLMIASGDWADVISCDQYYAGGTAQAYADEVIIDLTDLVYDNCPSYYNALYQTNEASIKNVTVEGKILGIYSIKDRVYTDSGEMTRADWLEALDLEVPKTLDQLTDVLYAFKNTYGCNYTVKCDSTGVLEFIGAFDTELASLSGTDLSVFVSDDGTVESGYISDGYREYLEWFSGLYADGIINPDFYTTTLFPDVFNGLVGSGDMAFWNSMADGLGNIYSYADDESFAQVAVPTIVRSEGDVNTFQEEDVLAGGRSSGFSITTTCEDPELVLQFFNYFYTDEGAMLRNFGVEGDTYTKDANGTVSYTELVTNNELGMTMNNALNYYTCVQVCPGMTLADSLWACYNDEAIAAMEVWEPTGTSDNVYPKGAALTTDEQDSIGNRVSDIISGASEQILKFMTGSVELTDDTWNAYLADMDQLGIQDVLDVYQNAYDEYLAGER